MIAPCKKLERCVLGKEISHGKNPALRWMASNVSVTMDPAGNMKTNKAKSSERIDGIVASLMALGRAMESDEDRPSRYSAEGFMSV